MPGRYFDEWQVGDRVEHSISRTVTETDNLLISTLTHNPQPLHLDHEAAAKTEFGKPLVNSVFTFGLMIGVSVNDTTLGTLVANLGYDKLVFPKPVFVGDTLRSESECIDLRESKSRPERRHRHLGAPQLQPARRARLRMHALRAAAEEAGMSEPRSWLFVPADSEKKIAKAIESEADAVIFDLEDSVAPAQKAAARADPQGPGQAVGRPAMVGAHQPARQRASQGRSGGYRQGRHPRHRPSEGGERRGRHPARAPHRQHPHSRDRHRDPGEPVRYAQLSRSQVAAGCHELGRGGPVGGDRCLFEI